MESKIPIPTDNVYKFYALFGLLLFVFSVGASIYTNRTANDVVFANIVEIEYIKQIEKPSHVEVAKRTALERKIEIAVSDRKVFQYMLAGLIALSIYGMYYGFKKWHHEIQPQQDEMATVQREIAKLQLEKMRKEISELNNLGTTEGSMPPLPRFTELKRLN